MWCPGDTENPFSESEPAMIMKSTLLAMLVAGTLVLLATVACRDAHVASSDDGHLPWLTVLAEEALAAHQRRDGVSERPIVNVATATGLERYTGDLSLVHGSLDRETRPRYVLRDMALSWGSYRNVKRIPPVPVEDPATPLPFEEELIRGPWTIALDRVEVDTEDRKVAALTVWVTTVPYVDYSGRISRAPSWRLTEQYRVEGVRDGRRWVANVTEHGSPLDGYVQVVGGRVVSTLPEQHIPDFVTPKEPGQ